MTSGRPGSARRADVVDAVTSPSSGKVERLRTALDLGGHGDVLINSFLAEAGAEIRYDRFVN